MKKLLAFNLAVKLSIAIMVFATIFNFLVLIDILPYTIVWGGRLQDRKEVIVFEIISILINILCVLLVIGKKNSIERQPNKWMNTLVWILPPIYFMGILGNLASNSELEKVLFVPLTVISFITTCRVALETNK